MRGGRISAQIGQETLVYAVNIEIPRGEMSSMRTVMRPDESVLNLVFSMFSSLRPTVCSGERVFVLHTRVTDISAAF